MWAHQYDQQANQVQVSLNSKPWVTNGPESNLYGLEPNFGCCTANFHQGWPKFAASLWMRSPDDGLVAALYSPCVVTTKVRGTMVTVHEETEYPFRGAVRITVAPETAVRFPMLLRVPSWAAGASVKVNGEVAAGRVAAGEFVRVDRMWAAGDVVEVTFPMVPRTSRGFNQAVAWERGPLVFSLDLKGSWVKLREHGPTADWQVFPTVAWNYGLAGGAPEVMESPVGARPFAAADAGVRLKVRGRQVNGWRSEDGVAGVLPLSPVTSTEPEVELTLIPYGAAKLRITAFPVLSG